MLLKVQSLKTVFHTDKGIVKAVNNASFELESAKTLCIVGESGSGKSISAFSIIRLLEQNGKIVSGEIQFDKKNLITLSEAKMQKIRGNQISMIFQEPMTSLNPSYTIGYQIGEVLKIHRGFKGEALRKEIIKTLEMVSIPMPEKRINEYPFRLSGGMRQRVMIAMAMACHPKILIADEPTTALDVTIQAEVLELMNELKRSQGTSILFITHDLGVVAKMADHVAVMYKGEIIEQGSPASIFEDPKQDYTKSLLRSFLKIGAKDKQSSLDISKDKKILTAENVCKNYIISNGFLKPSTTLKAVVNVSFEVFEGKTLSIVGESGSGKTTTAKMILGIEAASSGIIKFDDEVIDINNVAMMKRYRENVQIIFQDPYSSLNPRWQIGTIIAEPLLLNMPEIGKAAIKKRVLSLMDKVGLPANAYHRYAHQFSGGQRQRIVIARALSLNPRLIVCDEPVSALDVPIQAQVLDLMEQLQQDLGLTYVFISHDLNVVRHISDNIIVMFKGQIVEQGLASDIFNNPQHQYTKKLLDAVPTIQYKTAKV